MNNKITDQKRITKILESILPPIISSINKIIEEYLNENIEIAVFIHNDNFGVMSTDKDHKQTIARLKILIDKFDENNQNFEIEAIKIEKNSKIH